MKHFFKPRLQTRELIFFFKRLSFLLSAGLSLRQSLHIICEQSRGRAKNVYESVFKNVEQGRSFKESLAAFPHIFSSYTVHMIQAGETTGKLKDHTRIIAEELSNRRAMVMKLVSSLLYPCIIVCGTVGLVLFLIFFIFPKIKILFQSLHTTLPLSTRIILAASNFFERYGIFTLCAMIIFVTLMLFLLTQHERTMILRDTYILKIPVVGLLAKNYSLATFFRILGMMLSSSITLEEALTHAGKSLNNRTYRNAAVAITTSVRSGSTLSSSLSHFPHLFPQSIRQLVEIGETSGTLQDIALYTAGMLEQDIEYMLKNITNLIEPVLMVAIGFVVGFVALSIITPLYGITQHLKR